jgi:hypothetical protein
VVKETESREKTLCPGVDRSPRGQHEIKFSDFSQDHCTTSCEPSRDAPAAQPHTTSLRIDKNLARLNAVRREMIESLWNLTLDLNVLWKVGFIEQPQKPCTECRGWFNRTGTTEDLKIEKKFQKFSQH